MHRLAIISSHPIQYNAPLFKLLTERKRLELKVFYTWSQSKEKVFDPGFGKEREWDIPLLTGYEYEFVENISKHPGSGSFDGIKNPDLINRVQCYQPEALLVYGWSFHSHLKIIRHFKNKIPVWFRGDSNLLDEPENFSLKKILRRLFLKWVFKHIDKAFYVGSANKEYYLKHGLKEEQLIFAPHAIDNQRFSEKEEQYVQQALEWRRNLGISDDDIVILFAGKFESKKNPALLIEAFKKITGTFGQIRLILVGDGLQKEELKKLTEGLSNVYFLPFQNQSLMPLVYRLCNIFALPSQGPGETWGLAVNEAMACKRAILISDKCGCAANLVKDGENGSMFESNKLNNLVQKMSLLLNDSVHLKNMGEKSFEMIQNWCFEKICGAIEKEIINLNGQ